MFFLFVFLIFLFTFLIQSESSGFFSFLFFFFLSFIHNNTVTTGHRKWSRRLFFFFFQRVGRWHGKIRQSPGQLLTLLVKQTNKNKTKQTNEQTNKKSKAIVYSTSQQRRARLLLHNDYTSESVLDSHNAAL